MFLFLNHKKKKKKELVSNYVLGIFSEVSKPLLMVESGPSSELCSSYQRSWNPVTFPAASPGTVISSHERPFLHIT